MENKNTRRGFTQQIFHTGQTMPFTSPLEGEDVRRTDEGETDGNTYLFCGKKDAILSPHPAFGHPLPQGARKTTHGGFTLIELLVVVLIIGILAAVAVPQYQKAVEKARMTEAVINLRNISMAHKTYYLEHGERLGPMDINKLDITIPGTSITSDNRILTKYFVYAPDGWAGPETTMGYWALASRVNPLDTSTAHYNIKIVDNGVKCELKSNASSVQKQLCEQLNATGSL